jgi:hypothetical protein
MPSKSSDKVEIRIKVDKDLVDWLTRISKYLAPYTVDDIVVNVLKFYMNTWLMIENAIRHEELHQQQSQEEDSTRQKSFESTKQLLGAEPSDKNSSDLQRILKYRRVVKSFIEWLAKYGYSIDNATDKIIDTFIKAYATEKKNVKDEDIENWQQALHVLVKLKKSSFPVEEYIARYETGAVERRKSLVAQNKGLVNSFIKWLSDKGKNPSEVGEEEIREFLNLNKDHYSKHTIKHYHLVLKYFLDLYKSGEDLSNIIESNQ